MNFFLVNKKFNKRNFFLLSFVIISGIFLRFKDTYIESFSYWFDEIFTFYLSDPKNNLREIERILQTIEEENGKPNKYDLTPTYFYWLVQLSFKFFGHNPIVSSTLFSIISSLSILFSYYISRIITKNFLVNLSVVIFFSLNPFLIYHTYEIKVQTFLLFFFLINFFFFLKLSLKFKKYFILYILSLINLVSISPTSYAIIFAQIICFLFSKKKGIKIPKNFVVGLCLLLILILIFNLDYLLQVTKINTTQIFYRNFFIGFFFNNYFGSIYLGAIFLLLFLFFLLLIFKKKILFQNFFLEFNLAIIFFSYLGLIIYSLLFTPIIKAHYIIFVVPCIIFFIIHSINLIIINKKVRSFIILFIVFVYISNFIYYIKKNEIKNVNLLQVFNISDNLKNRNLNVSTLGIFYKYYFININKYFKNRFNLFDNNFENQNEFYNVCIISKNEKCDFSDGLLFYTIFNRFYNLKKEEVVFLDRIKLVLFEKKFFVINDINYVGF